ncbi:MAG: hypothetical protein FIA97_06180 [Methylococcaceae bacterium]|nr:hypothetical protein [Methylococcaceae bacterium]
MTETSSHRNEVGKRWLWLMDVIFGGIAAFAIRRFVEVIEGLSSLSSPEITVIVFGAFSVFVFFIYDITVLHFLYLEYPYSLHWLSTVRFVLDITMTFLLALAVLPVMRPDPQQATAILLVSISAWHLLAAAWHLLAHFEKEKKAPPLKLTLQHFMSPIVYWVLAYFILCYHGIAFSIAALKEMHVFIFVCSAIVLSSIFRSATLIPQLKSELT